MPNKAKAHKGVDTPSVASAGSCNTGNVKLSYPHPSKVTKSTSHSRQGSRLSMQPPFNPQPTNAKSIYQPQRGPATSPNVWNNGGGQSLVKSAITNNYNRQASQHQPQLCPDSAVFTPTQSTAQLTNNFAQASLNRPLIDPSNVPSQVVAGWPKRRRNAASVYSTNSIRPSVNNQVCWLSGFGQRNFEKGDIIWLPTHSANMDPQLHPQNKHLRSTCVGPVFSKKRMMVVLWLHKKAMFCVPIFSHQGTGLAKKQDVIEEYVAVRNAGKNIPYAHHPKYEPIDVTIYGDDLNSETTIHLTGGRNVSYQEVLTVIGELTTDSHRDLVELWRNLSRMAFES